MVLDSLKAVRWGVVAILLSILSGPALARNDRAALLIANAAYRNGDAPLPTPINDTRALAEALKRRGFTVLVAENATREAMQAAISKFARGIEPDGIALVFFSGYGIQAGRKNYLIPVDAQIWIEADVPRDGISLDGVLDELDQRRAGIRVTVLDAARRNPFEPRFRSFSQGLAPAPTTPGTLTLYATRAGGVINEGEGTTSPFVSELIRQIDGELTADKAFAAVRDTLAQRSRNGQVPALTIALDRTFSFDPSRPRVEVEKAAGLEPTQGPVAKAEPARPVEGDRQRLPPPPPAPLDRPGGSAAAPASGADENRAAADFAEAEALDTVDGWRAFLKRHPSDPLARKARAAEGRLVAGEQTRLDRERERLAELDRRIERNPRDEAAYYERGQFHALRGESAAALADFDQSLRLNPASPEAYNNRCWLRALAGDLERARRDCTEALRLKPDLLDALDSRGLVNLKAGNPQAAIADYNAALALDPRHTSSLYGRGVAYRRAGRDAQASRDLSAARELNPQIDKEFQSYGVR